MTLQQPVIWHNNMSKKGFLYIKINLNSPSSLVEVVKVVFAPAHHLLVFELVVTSGGEKDPIFIIFKFFLWILKWGEFEEWMVS